MQIQLTARHSDFIWRMIAACDGSAPKPNEDTQMMHYVHRWAIKSQALPVQIRRKIVAWIRGHDEGFYRQTFEPIALALEANDAKILKPQEKELAV